MLAGMYPATISRLGDLIDHGSGLSASCGNRPPCGRALDLDVYDLAIQFGRRQPFVRTPMLIRCATCGSRDIQYLISSDARPHTVQRNEPTNLRASRTEVEREALKLLFPRGYP